MATIKKIVELPEPHVNLINRDDLKAELQTYWVGVLNSHICIDKMSLKDGRVTSCRFFRKDLALVQYNGVCNAFIEPDGYVQVDLWSGVEITSDERAQIMAFCSQVPIDNSVFWTRQTRFLDWFDEHRLELDGMTPEEVVAHLEAAGF